MVSRRRNSFLARTEKQASSTAKSHPNGVHLDNKSNRHHGRSSTSLPKAPEEHMLKCLIRLHLLRARSARSRLLGNLNYFRSIQRRFALDFSGLSSQIDAIGAESDRNGISAEVHVESAGEDDRMYLQLANASSPANPNPRNVHHVVRETRIRKRILEGLRGPQMRCHHADNRGSGVCIRDATNTSLMYDVSLVDLRSLEDEMLRIASHYIEMFESANQEIHADQETLPAVDRFSVLCDLYENESWYQDAKRKIVEHMVVIYESTFHSRAQRKIAQDITDYMARRPIFGVTTRSEIGSAKSALPKRVQ